MPMKKSDGNMYPWVTHTHSHLAGQCTHLCSYCYVQAMANRFPLMKERYSGPPRLIAEEFDVHYGHGKIIFLEHLNDLWAESIPDPIIRLVCDHARKWKHNQYVFQTKNPVRYLRSGWMMPADSICGCTIETTDKSLAAKVSEAPSPLNRMDAMVALPGKKFITIEPILDLDVTTMIMWLVKIRPDFVNIGADSKGHGLDEPRAEKVLDLTERLQQEGIEIREKHNLDRLLAGKEIQMVP